LAASRTSSWLGRRAGLQPAALLRLFWLFRHGDWHGALLWAALPANFASPYQATNIIEFWRRWHITLSRFLRDYLYVPLGGNRRGTLRRHVNLMLTMMLGGL
jgi:D-alanyl-lipoteichoic acid acyltransferase DltB (MBOAT superfamily)